MRYLGIMSVGLILVISAGCENVTQGPAISEKEQFEQKQSPTAKKEEAAQPAVVTPRKPHKETPEQAKKKLEELGIEYSEKVFFDNAKNGKADVVELFLAAGMSPNVKDGQTWSPLMHAAEKGHVEVVQVLIDGGADVNQTDRPGNTALTWAAGEGQVAVVKLLLANGAEVNAKNESGKGPIAQAILYGRDEVVDILLQAGAEDPRR